MFVGGGCFVWCWWLCLIQTDLQMCVCQCSFCDRVFAAARFICISWEFPVECKLCCELCLLDVGLCSAVASNIFNNVVNMMQKATCSIAHQTPPPLVLVMQALERFIPDIRDRAELTMIGTPLTHERFLRRHRGR